MRFPVCRSPPIVSAEGRHDRSSTKEMRCTESIELYGDYELSTHLHIYRFGSVLARWLVTCRSRLDHQDKFMAQGS